MNMQLMVDGGKRLMMASVPLFSLLLLAPVRADDWKPAAGPLMTRWAKNVSPTNALPEYPRPQMVRKDWLNLNGLWDIKLGDGTETRILVPFAIESALSGVMKHSDRMTYRRSFEIPKDWSNRHVLLHFGAVDWEAKVSINGKQLGVHRGGYDAFSFDITAALKTQGAQEIVLEVFDPTDLGGYARGKQTLTPKGIMYTPTSGIWQTVWLEPVAETHIESLHLTPDLDGACLHLTVDGTGTVDVVASDAGKQVAKVSGKAGSELNLAINNPKLWSPDSPHLYDLSISLKSGDKTVDTVTSYFGMRKIALGKDENGVTRLMLNNKFIFQVGPLDQGFWPDGIYTAPTDEALRFDVTEMKRLGFNMVRKHIKVEPDRWYTWCDKLGLMVWQDMPSVNSYAAKPQPTDKPQFKTELERMVENHANHPAIIMWVLFNEAQGQHDDEKLAAAVRAVDSSRLINVASGGPDRDCSDVIDMHSYPGPNSPKPDEKRAAVLGEFGGLGLAVDGHRWTEQHWGYQGTKDAEELTRGYETLLAKAWALKNKSGLSAVIYTQLTDLETECNGLLTYDREVNKIVPARAAAVNKGVMPRGYMHSQLAGLSALFVDEMSVKLDDLPKDAKVYFTLDGTEPSSQSTEYREPVVIKAATTMKIVAVWDDGTKSPVQSQTFRKAEGVALVKAVQLPAGVGQGVEASLFELKTAPEKMPDFAGLKPAQTVRLDNFTIGFAHRGENFGVVYQGCITVPVKGVYAFYCESDDGSKLFIGDRLVVANDGRHGMQEVGGSVALEAGSHPIKVEYFQGGGGMGLQVSYQGPGIKKIEIPKSVLACGKKLKLACVGDSITEGFCVNKGMTWPEQIGRMLGGGWTVSNFGRGGTTLVSYQETPDFKNAKELNPDVVVIMLGTNESRPVLWKTAKAGFAGNYGAMVKQFAELPSKPRVFLCYPPFVANEKVPTENDFSEACILEQIPLVDEAAKAAEAGVIDVHGALKAKGKAAYNPDGGHPNDAGQTIIAKTVHAALVNKAAANSN